MKEPLHGHAPRPSAPWLFPLAFVVVIGVSVVGYLMLSGGRKEGVPQAKAPEDGKNLSPEVSQKLLDLRDQANAQLENLQFKAADPLLSEIVKLLPDDPFGLVNLVICREMAIAELGEAGPREAGLSKAREALSRLMELEPNSYVSYLLGARIAIRAEDQATAETLLRRAVELAPDSPAALYDLYTLKPLTPGEAPPAEARALLRKIHEREPENLFVLRDWLLMQAQSKASDMAQTASQAREAMSPYFGTIKQHLNADLQKLFDDLDKAITAGDWKPIERFCATIRNVVASEALRDDRYVKLSSLEFMKHDFGPKFYKRADLSAHQPPPAIPVKLEVSADRSLALPSGARDLVMTDFDLDSHLDGAALDQNRVVVIFPLVPASGKTPETVTIDLDGDFRGMVAVDLDDDKDSLLDRARKDRGSGYNTDPDLIVFGPAGVRLYENRQSKESNVRQFVAKPTDEAMTALRDVVAVLPGDLDLDGDLDFLTLSSEGVRIWSNRGNWTFEDITNRSKLPPQEFGPLSAVAVDWDRDTDLDVLLVGNGGTGVLENLHHGRLRWREMKEFSSLKLSQSLLVEDLDGNASWDLIGAGPRGVNVVLTTTSAAGLVSLLQNSQVAATPATKVESWDLDNDTYRDLLIQTEQGLSAWRGLPEGGFEEFKLDPAASAQPTAVVVWDVDRDGDEDFVRAQQSGCDWISNEGGNKNDWLSVSLFADQIRPNEQNYNKRVNHWGIGSSIELRSGARYQSQVVHGPVTHYGLGPNKKADVVRIVWANGIPRNIIDQAGNIEISEELKLHGSCPYLFTWDGEKFVFYTDLLWNAPLGLKFAETVIAPWREWEYLKVDGSRLKPKDGEYPLRVTAELWEIEYFDQIKLYAIDHPADIQVFTNEKVGPPDIAEHKIHTVRQPRIPVAARDTLGADVLDQVRKTDGEYTKTFQQKLAQGLTNEHWLELDLGPWDTSEKPVRVMLYLTGWMYPATTSLNVQFSQNPDGPKPRPPFLRAVDSTGEWKEVRSFLGFPGGKTKTIAVDISDVFSSDSPDHRIRIVTTMQFYWDSAFFTINEEPAEFRQTELRLVRAELRDRGGVSLRQWPPSGNGPEIFDYHALVPGDMWAPIEGRFTRFGDVRPLLGDREDQMVVMHPGDEIDIAFAVPREPIPEGWTRDFVINNVGWDKDCDLNTVYGETSEPMPFRAMTVYGESRPLDPEYASYLKTYQTRRHARASYWNLLRRPEAPATAK